MISETYSKKIDSCIKALNLLKINRASILQKHENIQMPDSDILKKDLFNSVLDKNLNGKQITYMNSKCKLVRFRDGRDSYEYGIDLILGWILEDGILKFLSTVGIDSSLAGNDRFREFLHPKKISTQPDIEIRTNNGKKLLEIMLSWKETWSKKGHLDLREQKLKRLKEHKALFLGIEPMSSLAFLIDFDKNDDEWEYRRIPGFFGKPGYTNYNIKKHLKNFKDILKIIKSI